MKVDNSVVLMAAEHSIREFYQREESLLLWTGGVQTGDKDRKAENTSAHKYQDILEISPEGRQFQQQDPGGAGAVDGQEQVEYALGEKDKQKIMLLQRLLKALTGKDYKFYIPRKIVTNGSQAQIQVNGQSRTVELQPKAGWGLAWDYAETYTESEMFSFMAEGTMETSDGRKIAFQVQLSMRREFTSQFSFHYRAGDAAKTDPLVINFDGSIPRLTPYKINFDLNADGRQEQIPFLLPGSGFLALDSDNNGQVDDGRELFGPLSGNGFVDLARYDADGNNWIDENDPVFDDLRIWSKDDLGRDQLLALWEKEIGAIYLGNINAGFDIKDNVDNSLMGQVRTAGIYISEKGEAGTLQQIDLVV